MTTTDTSKEYRRSALSRNTSVHVPLAVVGSAFCVVLWFFFGRIEAAERIAREAKYQAATACRESEMQETHLNAKLADISSRLKNIEVLLMQRVGEKP